MELQKQPGSLSEGEAAGPTVRGRRSVVEGWASGAVVEGQEGRGAAVFGCVKDVSETAAGYEVVPAVGGASFQSMPMEQQTDGLLLELGCLVHAGLTDNSFGLSL